MHQCGQRHTAMMGSAPPTKLKPSLINDCFKYCPIHSIQVFWSGGADLVQHVVHREVLAAEGIHQMPVPDQCCIVERTAAAAQQEVVAQIGLPGDQAQARQAGDEGTHLICFHYEAEDIRSIHLSNTVRIGQLKRLR